MIILDKFDQEILVQGERGVCLATLQEVVKGIAIYRNAHGEVFRVLPKEVIRGQ